jgi:hypothetical protein
MATDESKSWAEKLKTISTIIAIPVGIIGLLTTFGLVKREKFKALQWNYTAKSTVINRSAVGENIEILYRGRKLAQVSAVLGRLVNTGTLPIVTEDIKDDRWPSLSFDKNILSAEIKSKSHDDIKATVEIIGTNSLRIVHGLLNPGDFIEVQALFEGDVGGLTSCPPLRYRIAGIENPMTGYPPSEANSRGPTYIKTPRYLTLGILMSASASPFLWLLLIFFGGWFLRDTILTSSFLEKQIAEITAELKSESTPAALQRKVSDRFYTRLHDPNDSIARKLIDANAPNAGESSIQYLERVGDLLRHTLKIGLKWNHAPTFLFLLILAGAFVSTVLVFISAWSRV